MKSMQDPKNHTKEAFLIERIAFFSDAVFAIAITLMIVEIHPPVIARSDTSTIVWQKLGTKLPEFLGLIISFALIGSAWLRHHQLFAHVIRYDLRLLIVNLALLFTITLFPFSTSFLFNSLFDGIVTRPQVFVYLTVPLFSNVLLYIMYKMAHNRYIDHVEGRADIAFHMAIYDLSLMILSFLLALAWVLIMPFAYHPFGYIFLIVSPIGSYLKSKSNRKFKSVRK
jgi:uncharacterized membrane protein